MRASRSFLDFFIRSWHRMSRSPSPDRGRFHGRFLPQAPAAPGGGSARGREQPSRQAVSAAVSPQDVAANAAARADALRLHVESLSEEIARIKGEMVAQQRDSPSWNRYRQRARQLLRQKKEFERRIERAMTLSCNMAIVADIQESQRQARMYQALRNELGMPENDYYASLGQRAYSREELAEIMRNSNEAAEILGTPFDYGADEDELGDEIDRQVSEDYPHLNSHFPSTSDQISDSSYSLDDDIAGDLRAVQGFSGQPGLIPDIHSNQQRDEFDTRQNAQYPVPSHVRPGWPFPR